MKKILGITGLLVLILAVTAAFEPSFLLPANLENLTRRTGLYGVLAIGAAFVIITSGIDLSIGSMVGLTGCVLPLLVMGQGWPAWIAVLAVLSISAALGLSHGLLITKVGLQPFVVTLCGLLFYRGAARWITDDQPQGFGQAHLGLRSLATGKPIDLALVACFVAVLIWVAALVRFVRAHPDRKPRLVPWACAVVVALPIFLVGLGGVLGEREVGDRLRVDGREAVITQVVFRVADKGIGDILLAGGPERTLRVRVAAEGQSLPEDDEAALTASGQLLTAPYAVRGSLGTWMGLHLAAIDIPAPFLFLMLLMAVASYFLGQTIWGRHLLALGQNVDAARYSGVRTDRLVILAYVGCGLTGGIGGILFVLDLNSVEAAKHGNFFELYAIAAAVLGGCSLRGGEGSIVGVVIGTAVVHALYNSINLLGIPTQLEFAIIGAVILAGVTADELVKRAVARRRARRVREEHGACT
ncbi:MAG: ABC transporter permease [Planctomycetota bacterium]|nr:ABC transporter permease [Planctomycetota bacterium]